MIVGKLCWLLLHLKLTWTVQRCFLLQSLAPVIVPMCTYEEDRDAHNTVATVGGSADHSPPGPEGVVQLPGGCLQTHGPVF
jgi:hypothetical protein